MTAGIYTLQRLQKAGTYEYLDEVTGKLTQGILQAAREAGHDVCGGHIRGMFGFFFTAGPVNNFEDAKRSDTAKFAKFHRLDCSPDTLPKQAPSKLLQFQISFKV
jgi:glutamate-1-semialdehyde 2,1-aminomutase